MTIYETQQARKAAEVWRGPWESTLAAIREAKGAAECADVDAEQARKANEAAMLARPFELAGGPPQGWLSRMLFGAPALEYHPCDDPQGCGCEGYYE